MKKPLLLFLLVFASFAQVFAQGSPRIYVITADTSIQQFIDNRYWQSLDDKDSRFTLADIQKEPLANQFIYITKDGQVNSARTTWFRMVIKNNAGKNLDLSLAVNASEAEVYILDTVGVVRRFVTGNDISWGRKDGFKKDNAIPFELKQGEAASIFIKTVNRLPFLSPGLKFPLYNNEKFERAALDNYQQNYTASSESVSLILLGVFLVAGILNLLLFFTVRKKTYLYFALFSLCGMLSYGRPFYDISHTGLFLSNLLICISLFWELFLLQFVVNYLEIPAYHPRWNKWLRFVSLVFTLIFVLTVIVLIATVYFSVNSLKLAAIGNITVRVIDLFFWLSFVIAIIFCLMERRKYLQVFLLGMLPFLLDIACYLVLEVAAFFNASVAKFLFTYNDFFGYLNGFCLLWTAVVISWDLFKQYALQETQIAREKLEKEQLAREKEIQKNELIAQQKIELEQQVKERTSELKKSLEDLKAAQSQLIQSEKMVSLGELTAGIAHEIQNPLNFVNNFSDVNRELLEELIEEAGKGNLDEVRAIASDVIQNEEKINHHGKRADSIVKGMLEHSRANNGVKEPVDINALCDEYLRLSYHGLRAKDKSFNATLQTDFDADVDKVNLVSQDIGRVVLNLINNAFYAVNEKKKTEASKYEATVSISTKKVDDKVEIRITDNGDGIPESIKDKIFQPFFTTKPTGQGTGLGLSLSYDIIKAHDGKLTVETKEQEGTVFVIELPN